MIREAVKVERIMHTEDLGPVLDSDVSNCHTGSCFAFLLLFAQQHNVSKVAKTSSRIVVSSNVDHY